jgi:hypothetical protein
MTRRERTLTAAADRACILWRGYRIDPEQFYAELCVAMGDLGDATEAYDVAEEA